MLLKLLSVLPVLLATLWFLLKKRNQGVLKDITTGSVAYDHAAFGHILTWDKHCFYLNGKPLWILSGEFHYWRVPDRDRWRSVLLQYKSAGLNCIRIYFHWGYHSPGL